MIFRASGEQIAAQRSLQVSIPPDLKCEECGKPIGRLVSHSQDRLEPLQLEIVCPECVERIARSMVITLDSETSWGRLIAKLKGRR